MDLDAILCIKTERTLRNDFTVAHNRKLYQVEDKVNTSKVIVQDRLDGSIRITYKNRPLRFREITERPITEKKAFACCENEKIIHSPNEPSLEGIQVW